MARCTSFIYCTAVFCSIIFIVVGLLSAATSIAAYIFLLAIHNINYALKIMEMSSISVLIPIAFFLIIGLFFIGIGIFGLVKSRKMELTPKMMIIIAVIVVLIVIIIGTIMFVSMLYVDDFESRLDKSMRETIAVASSDSSSEERTDWDNVQDSFTCCGVTDGWDWQV